MSSDLLTMAERAHVNSLRFALEPCEALLIDIIDRIAPDPDPLNPALVEAVCKQMHLTSPVDKSFARAVLDAAQAVRRTL